MSDSAAGTAAAPVEAKVEEAGPCRKKLTVTVPAERVRGEVDGAFRDLIQNARVPGFRPGHLPRKVAELRYGKALRDDVRGRLIETAFGEAMEAKGLTPLGAPDLTPPEGALEEGKPFSFEVVVEVRPEVKVPELKGMKFRRPEIKVADADVEKAVEDLRLERAELKDAEDGTVAERDVAVVDAAVLVGGERVLEAGEIPYRHPSEVVAGLPVPGAAAAFLGKKVGEEVALAVTLPSGFRLPEHAGKEAELRLAIRHVQRFHLPALDAAFAKSLDFDSVEELREEARKAVRRELEAGAERAVDAALFDAALSKAPIDLPEGIVKREIGQVLARAQAEMHMQGASEVQIEERLAELQGRAADQVAREFRVAFLVDAVAKAKGIFVTEGEVEEQVGMMASRYRRPVEEMRRHLEQRDLFPSIRGRLRERKVIDALRAEVTIE